MRRGEGMTTWSAARLTTIGVVSVLALWLLVGCGEGSGEQQQATTEQQTSTEAAHEVFVGPLSDEIMMVGLDVGESDQAGARAVRAYVCDGLGPPIGTAVWFKGSVNGGNTAN